MFSIHRKVYISVRDCRAFLGLEAWSRINLLHHINTVYRTDRQAEFAAGAFGGEYRVHHLRCADDGVYRAGLHAAKAADAALLVDKGDIILSKIFDRWRAFGSEQSAQALHQFVTTRRALIDRRFSSE